MVMDTRFTFSSQKPATFEDIHSHISCTDGCLLTTIRLSNCDENYDFKQLHKKETTSEQRCRQLPIQAHIQTNQHFKNIRLFCIDFSL